MGLLLSTRHVPQHVLQRVLSLEVKTRLFITVKARLLIKAKTGLLIKPVYQLNPLIKVLRKPPFQA